MKRLCSLLAANGIFAITCMGQGTLTPASAPAPSMKSLAQVEPRAPIGSVPFVITTAGSYYLTTNLTGVSGTNGITVLAPDVSLDLNGFALIGVAGSTFGVTSTTAAVNFSLRNGTIRNWPAAGIIAPGTDATFEGVNVYSNSGSFGLSAGAYAKVRQCNIAQNGAGLLVGQGAVIGDSVIRNNAGNGIVASESARIQNCTIYSNSANGLSLSNACLVESCIIKTNGQNGIVGLANLSVLRCNISQNASNGVSVTLGGKIADCVISSNRVDGIRVVARCSITGNMCDYNGLGGRDAGIRLLSSDNRVDGNDLNSNVTGLLSDLGFNLIVRNKATLNPTNYNFHVNDVVGGIAANPTTANPWANFGY